jgi:hypothetical protein
LQLIGYTVIATLKVLESQDLLKPDSAVKDISLVLGLFMDTVKTWPAGYEEPELSWVKAAICLAKKHGIIFEGVPFGVEQNVQKFEELEDDEDAPNWKKFNWKKEVRFPPLSLCPRCLEVSASLTCMHPAHSTVPSSAITAVETPPLESAAANTTLPRRNPARCGWWERVGSELWTG